MARSQEPGEGIQKWGAGDYRRTQWLAKAHCGSVRPGPALCLGTAAPQCHELSRLGPITAASASPSPSAVEEEPLPPPPLFVGLAWGPATRPCISVVWKERQLLANRLMCQKAKWVCLHKHKSATTAGIANAASSSADEMQWVWLFRHTKAKANMGNATTWIRNI